MARDIRPGTVYELSSAPQALPEGLELRYLERAVLFAVTGRHTVAQIARAFELEPGERDSVFARLQEAGVLRERSLTYPEYLRASGTLQPGGAPVDLRRFLCAGITLGEAGAPEAVTADGEAPTSDPPATRIDAPPASGPPSTPGIPTAGPPPPPGPPNPGPPNPGAHTTGKLTPGAPAPGAPTPGAPTTGTPAPGSPTRGKPTAEAPAVGTTGPQEPVAAPKPPLPIAAAPSPSRTEIDDPALQTRLVRVADQALDAAGGEGPEPSLGFRPLSGPVPVVSQELVSQEPPVPAARPMKRLSLEAVMRFIMNQAADLQAGQLDVYRVFIRVNTKLLRRNGITTLRFEDDHLVSDPELQDAITLSLERTLGLRCPEACFL